MSCSLRAGDRTSGSRSLEPRLMTDARMRLGFGQHPLRDLALLAASTSTRYEVQYACSYEARTSMVRGHWADGQSRTAISVQSCKSGRRRPWSPGQRGGRDVASLPELFCSQHSSRPCLRVLVRSSRYPPLSSRDPNEAGAPARPDRTRGSCDQGDARAARRAMHAP